MMGDLRRGGHVAIIGRPNVGKSTLLNYLLGQRLSITTAKPQTTRYRILGILETPEGQLALLDTPGMHDVGRARKLHRLLNRAAIGAIVEADVIWFVIVAGQWSEQDKGILQTLQRNRKPVMLVVNKIDVLHRREDLLPFLSELITKNDFIEVIPLSARKKINASALVGATLKHLPIDGACYPKDMLTDRGMRFFSAEFIREQIMRHLGDEVPYACAVGIDQYEESRSLVRIHATIWVERKGQKAILIGHGGQCLKTIGTRARLSLETLIGSKVFLRLWVKTKSGWQDDMAFLQNLEQGDIR